MTSSVRARVKNGRLVVDEPTDLPEGTELELAPVEEGDALDDEDRARLHAALERADDQLKAGKFVDGAVVLARLRRGPM